MLAGISGEEKTTWCYRLRRVILLELNMLTSTMRDWTSQINSMRVGALVCLIVVGYQDLHRMSWRSIHCPWHQDELGVSGIEEKTGVTTVVICGYIRIGVCGCVWLVVRHHMFCMSCCEAHIFVQSEQGGYEYCWIWCRLIKVWMTKSWRVWCRW